jgi:hypothetical protein
MRGSLIVSCLLVSSLAVSSCGPGGRDEEMPAVLDVAPAALDLAAGEDTTYLEIANIGGGVLTFDVTVAASSGGQPWLTVQPTSGSAAGGGSKSVIVQVVNREALAPGTYTGHITVNGDQGESASVPVSMLVGQPILVVEPADRLDFGASDVTLTLLVQNGGEGMLDYKVQLPGNWLATDADLQRQIGPGVPDAIALTVERHLVPWYGAGSAELLVTSNGLDSSPHSNAVKLDVAAFVDDSCEADSECLKEGYFCAMEGSTGVCEERQGIGVECEGPGQCKSGFCVAGYCCESGCEGQCRSCAEPGKEGSCYTFSDNTVCSDDANCTLGDTCQLGECVSGDPPDCSEMDSECSIGECSEESGECVIEVDDGFCRVEGACVNGGAVAEGSGGCAICSPKVANDEWSEMPGGVPCDDTDLCTSPDQCQQGDCIGQPLDCTDNLECTVDECEAESGKCSNTRDANWCIIDMLCVASGDGKVGKDVECSVCDPESAPLVWSAAKDGEACDDGSSCSAESMCLSGECVVTVFPLCDDGNSCTTDTCAEQLTCQHAELVDGADCLPDAHDCTTDVCQGALCVHPVADGHCLVDGLCLLAGDAEVTNPCLECQPLLEQDGWTPLGDGIACGEGKVCHEQACCEAAENCAGLECGGDLCGGSCGKCDDGLDCTSDSCVDGLCLFDIGPEACVIGAACFTAGLLNLQNLCERCEPEANKEDWSTLEEGSDCGEDSVCHGGVCCDIQCGGKVCGDDGCGGSCGDCGCGEECEAGACFFTACQGLECGDDGCGGSCGNPCNDGIECTADICVEGLCHAVVPSGFCAVDGACAPSGSEQLGNPCKMCDPGQDDLSWIELENGLECGVGKVCADGICCDLTANCEGKECGDNGCGGDCGSCDDDLICTVDSCQEWQCAHQVEPFFCAIGDQCVTAGAENADNMCLECRPDDDGWAWSPLEDGAACELFDAICFLGDCCLPACEGADCGDDSCGGICGQCDVGQVCIAGICPPSGDECDDGNNEAWDGCTGGKVTEFLVDEECSSSGDIEPSGVAALDNGGYVVIHRLRPCGLWNCSCALRAAVFGATGQLAASPFQVHTWWVDDANNKGCMSHPQVTARPGGFIVVWTSSSGQDGSGAGVFGRLFLNDGTALGGEFQLHSTSECSETDPAVSVWTDGSFIACWRYEGCGEDAIGCQRFDKEGGKQGEQFDANQSPDDNHYAPEVAALEGGGAVVIWEKQGQADGNGAGVFGRFFDPEGVAEGGDFLINIHTAGWQEPGAVAALPGGGFVVAWYGSGNGGPGFDDQGIFARLYDSDGAGIGGQFRVNSYTVDIQTMPQVAAAPDGRFVVAWQSEWQDGTDEGIFFQRFAVDGSTVQGEGAANVLTNGPQGLPGLALFPDGTAVLSWSGSKPGGTDQCPYARRFAWDGSKLYR